ncbi:MAG TPA: hypothetical protein VGS01_09475 [Candidatus Limnocylindria bacterium]|jgi:hypothetical protein|nr:hypothetical protein [Candidatus Limnocylindria bacterium]
MTPILVDPTIALLVAAMITLLTPVLTVLATSWAKSSDRAEDRKDRNAVAEQAARAAQLLVESNERIAAKVASASSETNNKIDEVKAVADTVHTLVNSNMTKEMRARLLATTRDLRSLTEIVRLNRKQGLEPSPEALAEIEATRIDIAEQTLALQDREKQALAVATQKATTA